MRKLQKNLLIYLITIFFLIEFLVNSNSLITVFFNTIKLFINNLLPSIFIFFTITDILNNYNLPYYLSRTFGKPIEKIFKIPRDSSYIIFMSFFSGFPSSSKLIKDALDKEIIDSYDATKILSMTHFANPLFIITISNNLFHDKNIGIIVLLVHFITNFIIGFIFRNIYKYEKREINYQMKKPLNFIDLLKSSFYNTSKLLINVLGIILFFSLVLTTVNRYLNLNNFSNMIFNGLFELTTGLKYLADLNIEKTRAIALAGLFISFGGFSIHMQNMAILNKYDINYYIYLIARIIHATISFLLIFLILTHYN